MRTRIFTPSRSSHFHCQQLSSFPTLQPLPAVPLLADGDGKGTEPRAGLPGVVDPCPLQHQGVFTLLILPLSKRAAGAVSPCLQMSSHCSPGSLPALYFYFVIQGGVGGTDTPEPSCLPPVAGVAGTADYFKHPSTNVQLQAEIPAKSACPWPDSPNDCSPEGSWMHSLKTGYNG